MYQLAKTGQFKKDFKVILKRNYDISKIKKVFQYLLEGKQLPAKYKNHPLKGKYMNHYDCHIGPDWILIYKKDSKNKVITLIRTGTHSDLF